MACFSYFNGTGSLYICMGKYGTGFVKIWKTRHKLSVDVRIFFFAM